MVTRRGSLTVDGGAHAVQVFTPSRVQAVTEDVAWTPTDADIAFRNPEDISYAINGGTEVFLTAGSITGIKSLTTYTFSATSNIEVM